VIPWIKNSFIWILRIIVFFLITLLAYNAFTYFNFDFTYGFLRLKQKAIATGLYLPFYYSHVLVAGAILVVGFFQVNTRFSLRWPKVHKALGKFYVYGILFFAAPGGLVMSFFIQRGPWVLWSFVLQSVLWFLFTAIAIKKIMARNIEEHRKWMWRSYALTFAAVTLRLYTFFFGGSFDLAQPAAYGTIAWMSWVLNLVMIEIYLKWSKS
jgi:uncharacterized membrane protein YozB (DUF420 family)